MQRNEPDDWITIKIPKSQHYKIQKKIKHTVKYLTIPEFVRVAIEEKLERENNV